MPEAGLLDDQYLATLPPIKIDSRIPGNGIPSDFFGVTGDAQTLIEREEALTGQTFPETCEEAYFMSGTGDSGTGNNGRNSAEEESSRIPGETQLDSLAWWLEIATEIWFQ